jgi:hypothetical protein
VNSRARRVQRRAAERRGTPLVEEEQVSLHERMRRAGITKGKG